MREWEGILKEYGGIRLDIGCGANKQPNFVGIDMRDLPGVDIVHDVEQVPWPLPDECVIVAICSHLVEHINPHGGGFIRFMDECWRVLKPDAQLAIITPYAGSPGYWQDPTHCNGRKENT
jgi:predicted SAM-dependent methyltransferase